MSTVSYALRGDPKIPAHTAQRLRAIAARLGYSANPAVSALMAHIRTGRQPKRGGVLAFVWIDKPRSAPGSAFDCQSIAGVRERAAEQGFGIEEFHLADAGMNARRLSGILKARGIAGVIFSGCESRTDVRIEMDWSAHATAIIGNAGWEPELHRAAYHHFLNMRRALLELAARGYRRPAAWLELMVNERAHRAWEGAFLAFHPNPDKARSFMQTFGEVDLRGTARWLKACRPDAIILTKAAFAESIRPLLAGIRPAPGLVVLDLTGATLPLAGIDPGVRFVAANAVDLVTEQLYRNERGLSAAPKKLLFEGRWREGKSLRPPIAMTAVQSTVSPTGALRNSRG